MESQPIYLVQSPPDKKNALSQLLGIGILAGVGYWLYKEVKRFDGDYDNKEEPAANNTYKYTR